MVSRDALSKHRRADIRVNNFGCRLNGYESELIRKQLETLADETAIDDCVVINSCAVTHAAEKQVKQAIRAAARRYPSHKIIVTGCAAQIRPQDYSAMAEVDAVIGNSVKTAKASYAFLRKSEEESVSDTMAVSDIMAARRTSTELYGHSRNYSRDEIPIRAYLEIQNGCDHRCSFCTIPYGRGASRSLAPAQVLAHIERLSAGGAKEITLCGVDLTSYGHDCHSSLGRLLLRICRNYPQLRRLRLSSLDCMELDDDFLQAFADHRQLQPHLHLSLQSGCDLILKRMKRRHLRQDAIELCARLRAARADVTLGSDFICGFPTEDDSMFAETLSLVEACGLTWLHVFPYSAREGTVAARIPRRTEAQVRKARVRALRALGDERRRDYLQSLVGSEQEVLVHKDGTGYTSGYAPVRLVGERFVSGEFYRVRIIGCESSPFYRLLAA